MGIMSINKKKKTTQYHIIFYDIDLQAIPLVIVENNKYHNLGFVK